MNNASRVHYIFEATMDGRLTEQGRLERINRHVRVRNDGTGCLPHAEERVVVGSDRGGSPL
jgi:hypothetical protein